MPRARNAEIRNLQKNNFKISYQFFLRLLIQISIVFFGCSGLGSITLNEGLESISGTFCGYSLLKSIAFPSTMQKIDGATTFISCNALTKVISHNTVPPSCTSTMVVPMSSVESYRAASGWSAFTNIPGDSNVGIEGIQMGETAAKYYNMQGVMVSASELVAGMYIKSRMARLQRL